MKKLIYILLLLQIGVTLFSQNQFSVSISNDSVLIGNRINVEFKLENVQGDFEAPQFENMRILSGPNTASSFQSINGKSTSSITYTYIVEPIELGELIIDKAYLIMPDETLETDFVKINVYPNPDGIIQEDKVDDFRHRFDFSFPSGPLDRLNEDAPKKKKKKYKLKKI